MTALMGQSELVTLILYIVVGVVGSARVVRLVVNDDFPAIVKFRIWWDNHVTGLWNKLMHCMWCLAPWVVGLDIGAAYLFDLWGIQLWWFIVNGWLAASYVAAWLVYHDEG
jgi:hypothetical protein